MEIYKDLSSPASKEFEKLLTNQSTKNTIEKGKVIAKTEIEEWPKKWNKEVLYWDLIKDSEDIPGEKLERASIARALLRWQIVIKDLKFRRYNPRSGRQRIARAKPTIRIEFKVEDEESFYKYLAYFVNIE